MKNYQYQIIRYVHDRVTGEFVNVGLIIFDPASSFLQCKTISRYGRISHFFLEVKGHYLLSTLKQFESRVNDLSEKIKSGAAYYDNIEIITSSVLPKDDSAIISTEVKKAIDINLDNAFHDMYARLVDRYNEGPEIQAHNDNYAWQKYYKKYFEKYGLTKKLRKHTVKTNTDTINFDKSWKNGVWNCYESVSFDLSRTEAIKNKVYRWSGILRQLETSNEKMHIYFLTASSKKDNHLQEFIEDALIFKNKNVEVTLVKESEAEKFAEKVKKEMDKSAH